jgi:hypothetical protein
MAKEMAARWYCNRLSGGVAWIFDDLCPYRSAQISSRFGLPCQSQSTGLSQSLMGLGWIDPRAVRYFRSDFDRNRRRRHISFGS